MIPAWLISPYLLALLWNLLVWLLFPERKRNLALAGAVFPFMAVLWKIISGSNHPPQDFFLPFISLSKGWEASIHFQLDSLRLVMLLLLSFLSLLIQWYSVHQLEERAAHKYFHFLMAFFQAAMAGIFLAGNLLTLFVFWELVGILSYLLVQFWYEEKYVVSAAFRVIIINKAGDILLLAGIGLLCSFGLSFPVHQELDFPEGAEVFLSSPAGQVICLFFMLSAAVKSAQFPFSLWLKKAMAGPAAVSALLHSATMVAAGVWLMCRLGPYFPELILQLLAILGLITLLLANLAAAGSKHLKTTLAFSTIAQLGLMMAAIGAGRIAEAELHLIAHAFFKAGLFLLCGWLMSHLSEKGFSGDETQSYANLSGLLRHSLSARFMLGMMLAALAGMPFSSGYISKEALMAAPWHGDGGVFVWTLYLGMQAGAFLTAFYVMKIFKVLVLGKDQEPPLLKSVVWFLLMILSLASSFLLFGWNPFSSTGWLTSFVGSEGKWLFPDILPAIAGLLLAWRFPDAIRFSASLQEAFIAMKPLDHLWSKASGLLFSLAASMRKTDEKVLDSTLETAGKTLVVAGYFSSFTDRRLIDGFLRLAGNIFYVPAGFFFRQARQNAQFAAWFAVLVFILLIYFIYYQ